MYELWARKRPVDGVGSQYELVSTFENEKSIYSEVDKLDRNIYQKAIVSDDNHSCILYREFEYVPVKKIGTMNNKSS
ncbi:MAG: hypothetical protein IKQ35_04355 [Bacilli bacterium]|nr:hypothetical protein [Bacilli bacterium]